MTATEPAGQPITEEQRRWQSEVGSLVSYRYLGTYSESKGRHEAEGWVRIRRDMRGPVGLLAAPLGIALLDTAGINVDPLAVVAPTRIDMEIFEPALDVSQIHLEGRILREGRSQFFTESTLTDNADRSRVIALGGTHWAVSGPNPGFRYVDSRPGVTDTPDLPPLHEVFGARLRDDGRLEIPELTPELGRGGLHQGPFQVVSEAAAMRLAREEAGTDQLWIQHQGTSIISRGIGAPFVTTSRVIRLTGESVTTRVELRAGGDGDRLCSVSVCRFAIL
jgi:acyl-coenzyme A thioesterase PaaI-like protein